MFEVTEEDIQNLIDKHKKKNPSKLPIFDLKDLVQMGIMYAYGEKHMVENKVVPCGQSFNLYTEHKCITDRQTFLEIKEMNKLSKCQDTLASCWTGYNLALMTSNQDIQGYFKKDLLFNKHISGCCAIKATSDKIYIGMQSGNILYLDPVLQTTVTKNCHTNKVTSLSFESGHVLSSSLDGSIYYKNKIKISDSGILDVKFTGDNKILCITEDRYAVSYSEGIINKYYRHPSPILSLTYNQVGISSSLDGTFCILSDDGFNTKNLECSKHQQNGSDVLCYGLSCIKVCDKVNFEVKNIYKEETMYADIKEDIIAYSAGKSIKFRDLRSNDLLTVNINDNVQNLSFSEGGDMILVSTDSSPYILELRYL